ncbi:MAG TPA: ComEC family competence protein, partial [Bacteroidota bacterium]
MNETIFTKRPAVRVALLFMLGILIAGQFQPHSTFVLVPLVVVFIIVAASVGWGRTTSLGDVTLQVLVVALGAYLQSIQQESTSTKILDPVEEEPMLVDGRIESEPVRQEKKTTFVLKTIVLRQNDRDDITERRILTTLRNRGGTSATTNLRCGTRLIARVMVGPFPRQRNPGEFNYGRYLALNNIQGIASIADAGDVVVTEEAPMSSFSALIGSMQRTLYGIIDQYHSPQQASFLKGVILGYRADLSTEVKQSFMNTGTIHILAVSGSNVAVIVLIIHSMFGFLRLRKKLAGAATIVGVVIFMFITGAS